MENNEIFDEINLSDYHSTYPKSIAIGIPSEIEIGGDNYDFLTKSEELFINEILEVFAKAKKGEATAKNY